MMREYFPHVSYKEHIDSTRYQHRIPWFLFINDATSPLSRITLPHKVIDHSQNAGEASDD